MWLFVLQALWFILPAGIANIFASVSRYFPVSGFPIDFNKTWRGKRVLGNNKTWRGAFFGTVFGILTFWLQQYLYQYDFFQKLSLTDYTQLDWLFGFLLASGAIWGDALESFFKRQIDRAPGKPWLPFDQIDYSVGSLALASIIFFPGWSIAIFIVVFGVILHIMFNLLGYLLKIQKNKL